MAQWGGEFHCATFFDESQRLQKDCPLSMLQYSVLTSAPLPAKPSCVHFFLAQWDRQSAVKGGLPMQFFRDVLAGIIASLIATAILRLLDALK